jgi:hypothetical protein
MEVTQTLKAELTDNFPRRHVELTRGGGQFHLTPPQPPSL